MGCNLGEGVAALFSQGDEQANVFFIGYGGVLPVVVVSPAIAVEVRPLFKVVRESVIDIGIAVEVCIRATLATFLEGFAKDIHTIITVGHLGVIAVAVAIRIIPLERIVREGIKRVGYTIKV